MTLIVGYWSAKMRPEYMNSGETMLTRIHLA